MAEMMEPEDKVVTIPVIFWMFQKVEENTMMKREMEDRKKDPNGTSRDEK